MIPSGPAQAFTIRIAGWPLTLRFAEQAAALQARFGEWYRAFIIPLDPTAPVVHIQQETGAPFIPPAPGPWQVHTQYTGARIEFVSFFEQGWAEPALGRGELTLRPEGDPENFLRVWYAWQCVQAGALLLHASGVVRGGRGFAFFGPSGSGKTTCARLAGEAGAAVLSDDMVILKEDAGKWQVYGVPFRGEMIEAPRANLRAPLGGAYALVKDREHRVAALPPALAAARLAACMPFVMARPEGAQRATAACARLAGTGRVRALHFRRDAGFMEVIDGPG